MRAVHEGAGSPGEAEVRWHRGRLSRMLLKFTLGDVIRYEWETERKLENR